MREFIYRWGFIPILMAWVAFIVIFVVAFTTDNVLPYDDKPRNEDNITVIAEDLCLDWLQGGADPISSQQAVEGAVTRAAAIDKEPVDIHNALVASCPPYAAAAGGLPEDAWHR